MTPTHRLSEPRATGEEIALPDSLLDYWRILQRQKWLILGVLAAVVSVTAAVVHSLPDIYRAQVLIRVEPKTIPDRIVSSMVKSDVRRQLIRLRQALLSPFKLERIIEELNLYPELENRLTTADIVGKMQGDITLEVVSDPLAPGGRYLTTIRLAYLGKNPEQVAQVASRLASILIEEDLKLREESNAGTLEFIDREVASAEERLAEHENRVLAFRVRHKNSLPERLRDNLQILRDLREQAQGLNIKRGQWQRKKALLEVELAHPNTTRARAREKRVAALRRQLEIGEMQLLRLASQYSQSHPDVLRKQEQLRQLQAQIAEAQSDSSLSEEEENATGTPDPLRVAQERSLTEEIEQLDRQLSQLAGDQAGLEARIVRYQSWVDETPIRQQQLGQLERGLNNLRTHHRSLLDRKLSAEVSSNLETYQKDQRFSVAQPPSVPSAPWKPNRPLIDVMGIFAGLVMGVGLGVLREITDTRVKTDGEAAMVLGAPVLGTISHIWTRGDTQRLLLGVTAALLMCSGLITLLVVVTHRFGYLFF